MRNFPIRLDPTAPLSHRIARSLAVAGFRGYRYYWALAELLSFSSSARSREIVVDRAIRIPVTVDDHVGKQLYRGVYERTELILIWSYLRKGETMVDVGANVGAHTFVGAARVGTMGVVLSFEPNHDLEQQLQRVVSGSPELSHIRLRPIALGSKVGRRELRIFRGNAGLSTLSAESDSYSIRREWVPVATLDQELSLEGLDWIDVLKMDVEGWEAEVLRGSRMLLERRGVGFFMVEVLPSTCRFSSLCSILSELVPPYSMWRISSRARLRRQPVITAFSLADLHRTTHNHNVILVHPQVRERFLNTIRFLGIKNDGDSSR